MRVFGLREGLDIPGDKGGIYSDSLSLHLLKICGLWIFC